MWRLTKTMRSLYKCLVSVWTHKQSKEKKEVNQEKNEIEFEEKNVEKKTEIKIEKNEQQKKEKDYLE